MKNLVRVLAASVIAFCLVGCGQQAPKQPEEKMETATMPTEAPQAAEKAAEPATAAEPAAEHTTAAEPAPAVEPAK